MERLQEVAEITVSYSPAKSDRPKIFSSKDSFRILANFYPPETINLKEYFVVLYLSQHNEVIGAYRLSEGGMTSTVADIRLILAVALQVAAKGIVISHNHPSGDVVPSDTDKYLTMQIKDACGYMDIKLLDHLILSGTGAYNSFSDEGIIL